jgi:hypothetical protein
VSDEERVKGRRLVAHKPVGGGSDGLYEHPALFVHENINTIRASRAITYRKRSPQAPETQSQFG